MSTVTTLTTKSGLPIGFRQMRSVWQQELPALIEFAKSERFGFIDYGPIDADAATHATQLGVPVGTVDLRIWTSLLSPDAGTRSAAVVANASHIRSLVGAGVSKFLTVLAPADPALPRT